jgi:AHBA synthesis associated protein
MSTGKTAVIFDLDGVLVDSLVVMREAFARAYAEVVGDGEPPFEEYRRYMGWYFPDIMRAMGLPAALEGPFVRVSTELAAKVTIFDGVPSMLSALRGAGVRLAIATGKSGSRARATLQRLGLLHLFGSVVGGDDVAHPKPAPDSVLRALRELEVCAGQAMMVGDAPADIGGARAADVCAVAATWGTDDEAALFAAGPDFVVHHPAQLVGLAIGATAG